MVALARDEGFERVFIPFIDAAEAALIPGIEVIPVESLTTLVNHLSGVVPIKPFKRGKMPEQDERVLIDYSEIKGQEHVKRAMEVAAAGGHNIIMAWTTSPKIQSTSRAFEC
jgi:magnesium chelatase family protein